jgi:LysR family transcriptional activator of nhaA
MNQEWTPGHHLRHLNYNHLLYFWTVAREGSIAAAATVLHLTPQTISGQIKQLEASIDARLFTRAGRGLVLTDAGRTIMPYAEEIFSLGAELARLVHSTEQGLPSTLTVGIVNSLPKLVAYRTLQPVLQEEDAPRLLCYEGDLDSLLADLAVHKLDLILSDRPVPNGVNVRAYSHKLGESDIAFYGRDAIAERYEANFPQSLNGAPVLLPVGTTAIRRGLDEWFSAVGVVPEIVAEFDDSALMKAFGESGLAIYPAPEAIDPELRHMYGARQIGRVAGLKEQFYAISSERRLSEPVAVRIAEAARTRLTGEEHAAQS